MQHDDKTKQAGQPTAAADTRSERPKDLRDLVEDPAEDPKAQREKARDLMLGLL